MYKNIGFFILLFFSITNVQAKVVKYHIGIDTKTVNFFGKSVTALAIGDQIPGPTIEATVDDILEVTFQNKLDISSSIHWHGVLLPNNQDGVPYLTTQAIAPNSSFTYRYKVKHSGTYWYHSHTGLQEQRGVYGSIIFHPKNGERIKTDHDYVVVVSDWTNENPKQVLANLKKDGDYYALKKGSVQSWFKVLKNGNEAIKNRFRGSWSRMGPMDLSDVGYDGFLSNGKRESKITVSAGETVRIRLINAAASSYFNIEFAGHPMKLVAADGVDIKPIQVQRLYMAIAETYDVIVTIPQNKLYELRASSEDGTGYSSVFIGNSDNKVLAPDIPTPNLFLMNHMHHKDNMQQKGSMHHKAGMHHKDRSGLVKIKNQQKALTHFEKMKLKHHKMKKLDDQDTEKQKPVQSEKDKQHVISYMNNYKSLRAIHNTNFSTEKTTREVVLNLTGNMESYVWSFNNKTLLESDKILIKQGEVVRFVLKNQTMMHHPIHLHGHFFRVLNGQGNRSPLKHTVNVAAMQTLIIEFEANEEKDWFFHCHNLYHMKTGMARVVSYEDTTVATKDTFARLASDTWYFRLDASVLSNMTMGMFRASNTRNAFELEYDYNYKTAYDVEVIYERSFNRFLDIYAGGNIEQEAKHGSTNTAIVGIRYVLPLLIESDLRIDSRKRLRLSLGAELQLIDRVRFEWSLNTDKEYRFNLDYEYSKKVLLTLTNDSDYTWGIGLRLKL